VQEKHFKNLGAEFWRITLKIGINLHCELGCVYLTHLDVWMKLALMYVYMRYVLMNFAQKRNWIKNGRTITKKKDARNIFF